MPPSRLSERGCYIQDWIPPHHKQRMVEAIPGCCAGFSHSLSINQGICRPDDVGIVSYTCAGGHCGTPRLEATVQLSPQTRALLRQDVEFYFGKGLKYLRTPPYTLLSSTQSEPSSTPASRTTRRMAASMRPRQSPPPPYSQPLLTHSGRFSPYSSPTFRSLQRGACEPIPGMQSRQSPPPPYTQPRILVPATPEPDRPSSPVPVQSPSSPVQETPRPTQPPLARDVSSAGDNIATDTTLAMDLQAVFNTEVMEVYYDKMQVPISLMYDNIDKDSEQYNLSAPLLELVRRVSPHYHMRQGNLVDMFAQIVSLKEQVAPQRASTATASIGLKGFYAIGSIIPDDIAGEADIFRSSGNNHYELVDLSEVKEDDECIVVMPDTPTPEVVIFRSTGGNCYEQVDLTEVGDNDECIMVTAA